MSFPRKRESTRPIFPNRARESIVTIGVTLKAHGAHMARGRRRRPKSDGNATVQAATTGHEAWLSRMADALRLRDVTYAELDGDVMVVGYPVRDV